MGYQPMLHGLVARATLNRIEKARVTADTATVAKIVRALERAERE